MLDNARDCQKVNWQNQDYLCISSVFLYFPDMRVLRRLPGPRGRRLVSCSSLAYSGPVEERRKVLGRRIKRARRRAAYRSQAAFAAAIGINETSVARAETGYKSIGDAVFQAIETGLGWAEGCIAVYLETGDESVLAPPAAVPAEQAPPEPMPTEPVDPAGPILDELHDLDEAEYGLALADQLLQARIQLINEARTRPKSRTSEQPENH